MNNELRFHCEASLYGMGYKLHIGSGRPLVAIAKPIEFEAHEPGLRNEVPALTMEQAEAQELIDALWSAGLRPTQGKQSEGVTAAQGRHLEDMRALAFAKLNVSAP